MNAHTFRAAFFFVGFIVIASSARAVTYTATLLPRGGNTQIRALGISETGQIVGEITSLEQGAILWNDAVATPVLLNPSGYGAAWGASGTSQVGSARIDAHAFLWNGTAASAVDLNPAGFLESKAYGVSGTSQVGYGQAPDNGTYGPSHALLWHGTAASVVDLHPTGFYDSQASGVSGESQAGYGTLIPDGALHAILWHGTAASAVDLNPNGYLGSEVLGVAGENQVGAAAIIEGQPHALMWSGTAASAVDLNPAGFDASFAQGVSGAGQVGFGYGPGNVHALLWHGTAASVVDLHATLAGLGPTFFQSFAWGISENGSIVGFADTPIDFNGHSDEYAILWTPAPESGVAGDYNNNGVVDAADYVLWRKGTNAFNNEVATLGTNTPEDYAEWRTRFGNPSSSGAEFGGATVPEPNAVILLFPGLVRLAFRRKIGGVKSFSLSHP